MGRIMYVKTKSFWRRLFGLGPTDDEIKAEVFSAHFERMREIEDRDRDFEQGIRDKAEQVYRDFRRGPFWSMMGDAPFRPADGQGGTVVSDGDGEYRRISINVKAST